MDATASRFWTARVEYLLTFQPKEIQTMFLDRTLKAHLTQKVLQAKAMNKALKQKDLARDQREEIVMQAIAPTEGQPTTNRLPESLELQIQDWAQNPTM